MESPVTFCHGCSQRACGPVPMYGQGGAHTCAGPRGGWVRFPDMGRGHPTGPETADTIFYRYVEPNLPAGRAAGAAAYIQSRATTHRDGVAVYSSDENPRLGDWRSQEFCYAMQRAASTTKALDAWIRATVANTSGARI